MKFIIRVFMAFSALIFALVTVIKFVQGCTYKEAVGIAEELYNEIKESCTRCCAGFDDNDYEEETQEDD